jgi:DNA-binding response OmpR family regulator
MHIKKTILIVEDEKSLREAIVDILHLKNFKYIEAKNGKEGVKMALLHHPDLILLDLIMPEMDGMMALKKIREDVWGKDVPIIILTNLSSNYEQNLDKINEHKITHYLVKSDWKIHSILKKIEEVLK